MAKASGKASVKALAKALAKASAYPWSPYIPFKRNIREYFKALLKAIFAVLGSFDGLTRAARLHKGLKSLMRPLRAL